MLLLTSIAAATPGAPRAEAMLSPAGYAVLSEDTMTVQTKETVEWIYAVGSDGMVSDDYLTIHDPVFHGMRWSKWGELTPYYDKCTVQTDSGISASYGLITAHAERSGETLADVELLLERSNCSMAKTKNGEVATCDAAIHEEGYTTVTVLSGSLQAGDTVVVTVGDVDGCYAQCEADGGSDCSYSCESARGTAGCDPFSPGSYDEDCGHCGFEAPDRSFEGVWWLADECLSGGTDCTALDPVLLTIQPKEDINELLVTAPSQAMVGEAFKLKAALLDFYGNPIATLPRTLTVSLEGAKGSGEGLSHTLTEADGGWHDFSIQLDEPDVYWLKVSSDDGFEGVSNPIEVHETPPEYHIFWGDIHSHHGYTYVDEDGQYRDFNHDYGRDVVGLDVVSESLKAKGIEIDAEALWTELQDSCSSYSVADEYLVLLGFEWVGDDAARATDCWSEKPGESDQERRMRCSDGHHNIYYDSCDGALATQDVTVIDGLESLWGWLDAFRTNSGQDAVSIPHAMTQTAYNFDLHYGPLNTKQPVEPGYPGTQTLVEVYSEWGDTSNIATNDGSLQKMMTAGARVGWIGGSDNHDGWMGNPYTTQDDFGDQGPKSGLGAFLSSALTRADIFESMESRRTYATSGIRPIIHFSIEDEAADTTVTLQQGSELLASTPTLHWTYHGTREIESLRVHMLVAGGSTITPRDLTLTTLIEDGLSRSGTADPLEYWNGDGDVLFWLQVEEQGDEKAWSSPIWLTGDCSRRALGAQDPLELCGKGSEDTGDEDTGDKDTGDKDTGDKDTGDSDDSEDSGDTSEPPAVRCTCDGASGASAALLLAALVGLRRRRD